jgi:NAD(P)-dependent dehydrogenase (short-subunit alcohol dehydrogenase family)
MQGKVVVATGATSGIGEVAAVRLAEQGARIVFIARDPVRASSTLAKLNAAGAGVEHRFHLADLSLMADTRRVAAEIAAAEPRIDVLINNAGAVFTRRIVTSEGLEMTFALNHMAYFVLTQGLMARLTGSAPARIVNTASAAHQGARLDFDDLQSARSFSAMGAYGRSKLCNILFTRELARRLAGTRVTANCLHPGVVATRFGDSAGGLLGLMMPLVRRLSISPERGAETIVYLAASPAVEGVSGLYFAKCAPATPSRAAQDDDAAARLWADSEQLAGPIPA